MRRVGLGFLAVALALGAFVFSDLSPTSAAEPTASDSRTGVVTTADASPVEGAEIIVNTSVQPYFVTTRTDNNGAYSITWPCCTQRVTMRILPRGGSLQPFSNYEIGAVMDVTLNPYRSVSGTVVDNSGKPAAGILVTPTTSSAAPLPDPMLTDGLGNFTLTGLEDNTWKFRFEDPSGQLATTWFGGTPTAAGATEVAVTGDYTGVNQTLQPGSTISGITRSSTGVPIGQAAVTLTVDYGSIVTYADNMGRFTFSGLQTDVGTIGSTQVSSASQVILEGSVGWVSGNIVDTNGSPRGGICPDTGWFHQACTLVGLGDYVRAVPSDTDISVFVDGGVPASVTVNLAENEVLTDVDFVVEPPQSLGPAPSNFQVSGSYLDDNGSMHVGTGDHDVVVNGCEGGATGGIFLLASGTGESINLSEDPANPGRYLGVLDTSKMRLYGNFDVRITLNCSGGDEVTTGQMFVDRHVEVVDANGLPIEGAQITEENGGSFFGPWQPRQQWDVREYVPEPDYPYLTDANGRSVMDRFAASGWGNVWTRLTASKDGCSATSYPFTLSLPRTPLVLELDCSAPPTTTTTTTSVPTTTTTTAPPATTSTTLPPATPAPGYWMLEYDATIYGFGAASSYASSGGEGVALATTPDGKGLWELRGDGTIVVKGTAINYGNINLTTLAAGEAVSALSVLPNGSGYWVFSDRGRAIAFGSAVDYGDMTAFTLNGPVVASAATPTGLGYYMIGSDGGVFAFGDAKFAGSMGGIPLNQPVVGIAPDPDNNGYWLVAADGGIFAFNAGFKGSMGGIPLNAPVIGSVAYADGYLLVGADGGIFNFSSKPFLGSLGGNPPDTPIRSVAAFTN